MQKLSHLDCLNSIKIREHLRKVVGNQFITAALHDNQEEMALILYNEEILDGLELLKQLT